MRFTWSNRMAGSQRLDILGVLALVSLLGIESLWGQTVNNGGQST